ncbi:hypothetical protein GQ43DRAFT_288150 [Delitschia confertaspora ATCC 74209]|uniref:Uncharacterized protein n=1 Tax=Delitschia confertaspora ATCC 74209 TaxID=1513339 RepID=A0A9P4JP80_9PLEO|nr:hypothetical protein GQ43DRAFT_288150 [Delitschia confertaspora ATCC 74209]
MAVDATLPLSRLALWMHWYLKVIVQLKSISISIFDIQIRSTRPTRQHASDVVR